MNTIILKIKIKHSNVEYLIKLTPGMEVQYSGAGSYLMAKNMVNGKVYHGGAFHLATYEFVSLVSHEHNFN